MSARAAVVFLWHMHQPEYRDPASGRFRLPWVLAARDQGLRRHGGASGARSRGMRAVVNFVPVLLDQIDDYAQQFGSGEFRDPLLAALARAEGRPLDVERADASCSPSASRANHERMIAPFPAYARLRELGKLAGEGDPHALPRRCLPRRPARLVPPRVDRRNGAPRPRRAIAGVDGEGQRLHGGGSPRAARGRSARSLHGLIAALPGAAKPRARSSSRPPRRAPDRRRCCSTSRAPARRGRRLPLPQRRCLSRADRKRLRAHVDAALAQPRPALRRAPTGLWPAEGRGFSEAFLRAARRDGLRWSRGQPGAATTASCTRRLDVPAAARAAGWRLPSAPGAGAASSATTGCPT